MTKIGFSASLPSENLDMLPSQLDKFNTLGIDSVELPIYEIDIIVGKKILFDELKKLQSIIKLYDFDYTIHGELSVNLMDEKYFDDHKEVLKKDIEVSGEIGATHLITHFGYTTISNFDNKSKYEDLLKNQNECYADIADFADKHNVTLAIECLFPFEDNGYAPLPNEIALNLNKINHKRIKACLDISHAYINCTYQNSHFINEIKDMAPLSEHVHMHDSFGILQKMRTYIQQEAVSYGLGDIHLPLGWGTIPFEKIFDEINLPKNTNLNFELLPKHHAYFEESIKIARELSQKI
ncbi:MAG: hypothetical protein CFH15_00452 [Alphaproteobacteria bacterium MarineAlpha5_Bin5]|nr:MAG: hypothetical protein CFH15_00452 [Alphaproteobacteria bacterium MarineAlpha5_Bin5]|tara:strand:- start:556 stop:1440 length:885 start_codon:yes stop_codon:yes gene_type:complete